MGTVSGPSLFLSTCALMRFGETGSCDDKV